MSTFPATIFVNQISKQYINDPDVYLLEDHTIATIRKIPSFFSTKPIKSKLKLCIINNAEKLQIPAQNALLKILEEPGAGNYIELYTQNPRSLLPTILSRCHIVGFQKTKAATNPFLFPKNLPDSLLKSTEISSKKDEVALWIHEQISANQQLLLKDPSHKNKKTIDKLLVSLDMLKHNVDPRSCLDWLFLS